MFQVIQNAAPMQRKMRRPSHTYAVQHRPYAIQPFVIAPVLPGETLTNLNLSGRAISDPLKTGFLNIMPWWHETYFFYVKLRDLDGRDAFEEMLLKNTALGLDTAADDPTYHQGGAPNFTLMCLKRVTEEYFRNEGETWNAQTVDGLPMASAVQHGSNWADSLIVDGALPTNNDLQNPEGERDAFAANAEAYERMRAMRMIDMSFEEWLETFGIKGAVTRERDKPELIRYARNWTYPTNTVEPTTGVPSGAVSWSLSERADKDRFFTEPGFIFGVSVVRAKLYMGNQRGSAVSMLNDAYTWLNALMRDRPETSVKEFVGPTSPTGPLRGQTANYWVDVRDLFLYGDQFVAGLGTLPVAGPAPALPAANGEKRWVTSTQINDLFATSTVNKIRQDGVVSLNIKGHATTATDNT